MTAKGSNRRSWTNSDLSTRPPSPGFVRLDDTIGVRPHELLRALPAGHPARRMGSMSSPDLQERPGTFLM
jgi:hypothetical protein